MKKLFLSLILCIAAVTASAQLKSIDAKFDYLWDTGVGAGVTYGFTEQVEAAASFSLFFPGDDCSLWTAGADVHYILPINLPEQLNLYPLVGAGFYHYKYQTAGIDSSYNIVYKDATDNTFFVNAGFGARWSFNEKWAAFVEEKYQIVKGWNHNFLSAGISYKF